MWHYHSAMTNIPRLGDWLRWLIVKPWLIWVCVIILLVAAEFVWACSWSDAESRARWAGTALQLLGLATTAFGIQQTRRQFGHRTIFETLAAWYARRPKRNIVISTGTGILTVEGGDAVHGVGTSAAPPGLSIEQRVKRLEDWLPLIDQRAAQIDRKVVEEAAARKQGDTQEQSARELADAKLAERLELSATGGLRLSAAGLTWLVAGTVLSGFAAEITPHANLAVIDAHHSAYAIRPYWPAIFGALYFVVALGFSIFYGWKALAILTNTEPNSFKGARLFHQRWLNFIGSAAGWLCLWFVVVKVWLRMSDGDAQEFGWSYAALALIGFVGVSGYLPFTIVTIVNSIGTLIGSIPALFKPKD
jgi:hypothetical protein